MNQLSAKVYKNVHLNIDEVNNTEGNYWSFVCYVAEKNVVVLCKYLYGGEATGYLILWNPKHIKIPLSFEADDIYLETIQIGSFPICNEYCIGFGEKNRNFFITCDAADLYSIKNKF